VQLQHLFQEELQWILPKEITFCIDKGEGILKDYQFGKRAAKHKFSPQCGTGHYEERKGKVAGVNARALPDVDMFALNVIPYDISLSLHTISGLMFISGEEPFLRSAILPPELQA
jgi:hypothetical protein